MTTTEEKLVELEKKINIILKKLELIDEGTNKMSKHIEFIEGVYGTVSTPMYWICNKVNRLRGEIKDTSPAEPFDLINKTNVTKINRLYTTTDDMNKNKNVNILEQD
tara:strand:+ start:7445 stop:7765 length:321 start_codon:yes stop_codon:yes gene_type:complete